MEGKSGVACRFTYDGKQIYGSAGDLTSATGRFESRGCFALREWKGNVFEAMVVNTNDRTIASEYRAVWADRIEPLGTKDFVLGADTKKYRGCLAVSGGNHMRDFLKNRLKGRKAVLVKCHTNPGQLRRFDHQNRLTFGGLYCLDVSGASRKNGAQVIAWTCHGGANQKWYLTQKGELRSGQTHKCLTVDEAKKRLVMTSCRSDVANKYRPSGAQKWTAAGAPVAISVRQNNNDIPLSVSANGRSAQKCTRALGECLFFYRSGTKVTVKVANTAKTHFVSWKSGPCKNRKSASCTFKLTSRTPDKGFVTKTTATMADTVKAVGFLFKSQIGNKCVDNTGSRKANAQLHMWDCNKRNANQRFVPVPTEPKKKNPKMFRITSKKSGLCLSTEGWSKKKGSKIVQAKCNRKANQTWELLKMDKKNWFNLRNANSRLCVDISGGKKHNGAKLIQWACGTNKRNQRFRVDG